MRPTCVRFNEYSAKYKCSLLSRTEQNETYLSRIKGRIRVCKTFPSETERCKEELAYRYFRQNGPLRIPKLTYLGEDFLEIEYIRVSQKPSLQDIVVNIAPLYIQTRECRGAQLIFPSLDLSTDKLVRRVSRLGPELGRRGLKNESLLRNTLRFAESVYEEPPQSCLVHGDLKSPHVLQSKQGLYYIDLGLVSIASPWYDVAFLYMESKDKANVLTNLTGVLSAALKPVFGTGLRRTRSLIRSAIVYRSVHNLLYSLHHRPERTVERVIGELTQIIGDSSI